MDKLLLIFTREYDSISAKSRLRQVLSTEQANQVHQLLYKHTMYIAEESDFKRMVIIQENSNIISYQFSEHKSLKCYMQKGSTFTERFNNALLQFADEFVCVIGSDCPALSSDLLNQVYHENLVSIGPTQDLGFYLLAGKNLTDYNYESVFNASNQIAELSRQTEEQNRQYILLKQCRDIDTYQDLKDLNGIGSSPFAATLKQIAQQL